jgi:hypothetical protein
VLGLGAGILMAISTTQLMTGLLFEVRALYAATFVSAPLLLSIVATIASYLPARPQRREKALRHDQNPMGRRSICDAVEPRVAFVEQPGMQFAGATKPPR